MIVIVKPVGNFCNLRCIYCFYSHLNQACFQKMKPDLLKKLIKDMSEMGTPKVTIIWHGGEPLLAGLEFYKLAVAEQKLYPQIQFENRLQTNATLLNEQWVSFFKDNDFGIGVSLDGTKRIQDLQRPSLDGSPTFNRIMENLNLMRKSDLKFGLIQTMTSKSLGSIRESQEFFYHQLGLRSWKINFVDEGSCPVNVANDSTIAISKDDLFQAYNELIEFWLSANDPLLEIDELDSFVAAFLGKRPCGCNFSGSCGSFLCVDYNGLVYPCDRICFNDQHLLGNLRENSLFEIMTGNKIERFRLMVRKIHQDCISCKWQPFCNNGCTAMHDDTGKYRHCEVRKKVFEKIYSIAASLS